jgi:xanthine dehydrogenase small subunit
VVGGGTDLYVQQHDDLSHQELRLIFDDPALKGIQREGNRCRMGGAVTVTELIESPVFTGIFPRLHDYAKLVSSTPIRNMATIAGNFINASPIGDLTIFFLALDAQLELRQPGGGNATRTVPLRRLYKGYKQLDKQPGEIVSAITFELPDRHDLFNFEKVSKRTHLDIASVNSAIHLKVIENKIEAASVSAGGVSPVPLYLANTSRFLDGKIISNPVIEEAINHARAEISPISDARGSKAYKSLLLGQLIKAHFLTLFPKLNLY